MARQKTIEQITGREEPREIPFYEASKLLLQRVEETAKLLVDDAARKNHYQTWADFCTTLAQLDGTMWYFKKLSEYFANQSRKYSSQQVFERLAKRD